ncbi:MAG: hypothetical protein R3E82_15875 [Pseudomonadales bacterium]|nr:hypothetical protein [Pseudomonadales bacterium]
MTVLALHTVETIDHLVSPTEYSDVNLHSPALSVFTDFRKHEPVAFDGMMRATDAALDLRQSRPRLRLVVDRTGEFIGTVTLRELSEVNLLRRVANGMTREDLLVMDVMKHRHEHRALWYDDLSRASVKDLVDTLQDSGESHCLVVEGETHSIRGLIAASDMERRLHANLSKDRAPTFAEIFAAVHG